MYTYVLKDEKTKKITYIRIQVYKLYICRMQSLYTRIQSLYTRIQSLYTYTHMLKKPKRKKQKEKKQKENQKKGKEKTGGPHRTHAAMRCRLVRLLALSRVIYMLARKK